MATFKRHRRGYESPELENLTPGKAKKVRGWLDSYVDSKSSLTRRQAIRKGVGGEAQKVFGKQLGSAVEMVEGSILKSMYKVPKDIPSTHVRDYLKEYARSRATASAVGKGKFLEQFMQQPKKALPLIIAAAGLMYGASRIGEFLTDKSRQRGFLEMMKVTPELKKLNKVKSIQLYNSLWDLNRHIAKNPVAAGSFVRQHLEMGLMPAGEAAILMQARKPESRIRGEIATQASKKILELASSLLI